MEDIMNSFKKMITNTTIHIIPDDEETPVNTERFLTLRDVWTIEEYSQNGRFLDQVKLVSIPLAVLISSIECSI